MLILYLIWFLVQCSGCWRDLNSVLSKLQFRFKLFPVFNKSANNQAAFKLPFYCVFFFKLYLISEFENKIHLMYVHTFHICKYLSYETVLWTGGYLHRIDITPNFPCPCPCLVLSSSWWHHCYSSNIDNIHQILPSPIKKENLSIFCGFA